MTRRVTSADHRTRVLTGERTVTRPLDAGERKTCEIHYWPTEGLRDRVAKTVRERKRMGVPGVAYCAACKARLEGAG